MSFPCNQCGACCRNISGVHQLSAFDNGDGICVHLTDDNLCNIYATRPICCNIDGLYVSQYSSTMSREQWYEINQAVCKRLQRKEARPQ